jgi:rubrerythrin
MKRIVIIPVLFFAGILFFSSCGNGNSSGELKSPLSKTADTTEAKEGKESNEKEENEKEENKSNAMEVSMKTNTDANAKTMENLQAAFKGETTASAKYAAYSKKAEQEGYHEIALLFKAASTAENIHANNHKAVLQESGVSVPTIKPEFTVKSTEENLKDAIAGESYEASTMYPQFLTEANTAGNQLAMISLNYAYKTEKKHKVMYENALGALQSNVVKTLPSAYYVCPTCGNTYDAKPAARCGISMTSSEKFIKINSI